MRAILALMIAGLVQDNPHVVYRTLDAGLNSRIALHRELVLRSPGAWRLIWFKHHGEGDAPDVDMRREMVLALFAGHQLTHASSLDIVSLTKEAGELVVRYRVRTAAEAPASRVDAHDTPFLIIAVPGDAGPVRFLEVHE